MKPALNLKFLPVLLLGVGALVTWYSLSNNDEDERKSTTYGDPDGKESSGEVSSFVD